MYLCTELQNTTKKKERDNKETKQLKISKHLRYMNPHPKVVDCCRVLKYTYSGDYQNSQLLTLFN